MSGTGMALPERKTKLWVSANVATLGPWGLP
jgi:hypothetical protein